jgi:iron complex outermembrane recepter protein
MEGETMRKLNSCAVSALAILIAVPVASPVFAQDTAEDESPGGIADIIVTAEKRSTNVQDVPISITAIGADELNRANVIGTRGLSGLAPNVNIGQDARGLIVSIRGVSSANVTFSRDPSVAFHVDGVYMPRPTGASGTFFDLDRVEILRGPQGTLYGRNSTGGTVNVITAKPDFDGVSGYANASYGNYEAINVQGAINLPIVADKVALRVAATHSKHSGYAKSLVAGKPSLDDQDDQAVRANLLIQPSDSFRIVIGGDYQWQGGAGQLINLLTDPPRAINFNADGKQRNRLYGAHADLTYSFPGFDVTSLTSVRRDSQNWLFDGDNTAIGTTTVRIANVGKQFTQEVRAVSTGDGPFKWIIGGFYLREINADKGIGYSNVALDAGNSQTRTGRKTTSKSAFGQFDYTIADVLTLTAGVRYTKDFKIAPNGVNCTIAAGVCVTPNTYVAPSPFKGNKTTWRLGAKWDVSPSSNIYASVARGYKAGGFNSPPFTTYEPEVITAYEVGTKNRFLDNTLQFNASAFFYDYTDFQVNSAVTINNALRTLISNAGSATVKGVEIEAVMQPVPELRIDASVGYLYTNFDSLVEAYDAVTRTRVDLTGNELPRAPNWTWRVNARYDIRMGGGTLTPSIALQSQSDQFFSEFNSKVFTVGATTVTRYVPLKQDGFAMIGASLRYSAPDDRWFIEAFGQNLGNRTVLVSGGLNQGNIPTGSYAPPRTYGIKAGAKF